LLFQSRIQYLIKKKSNTILIIDLLINNILNYLLSRVTRLKLLKVNGSQLIYIGRIKLHRCNIYDFKASRDNTLSNIPLSIEQHFFFLQCLVEKEKKYFGFFKKIVLEEK
jgi:hypothetical protein